MNSDKYYKVVNKRESKYESIIVTNYPICVCYKPGKWAEPSIPGSKLFVFNNLEQAEIFNESFFKTNHEIWECEVENIQKEVFMMPWMRTVYNDEVFYFWNKIREIQSNLSEIFSKQDIRCILSDKIIPGTVCVDRVKLTKKIS